MGSRALGQTNTVSYLPACLPHNSSKHFFFRYFYVRAVCYLFVVWGMGAQERIEEMYPRASSCSQNSISECFIISISISMKISPWSPTRWALEACLLTFSDRFTNQWCYSRLLNALTTNRARIFSSTSPVSHFHSTRFKIAAIRWETSTNWIEITSFRQ